MQQNIKMKKNFKGMGMKIPVKFYTDVTGFSIGQIAEIAGKFGNLVRVGEKQYVVELIS